MKDYAFLIHYPFLSKPLQINISADSLEQAKIMADLQATPFLDHKEEALMRSIATGDGFFMLGYSIECCLAIGEWVQR